MLSVFGDARESKAIAEEYGAIARKELGPDSDIAVQFQELGAISKLKLGDFENAIKDFEVMLDGAKKRSGENSIAVAKVQFRLADAHFQNEAYEQSLVSRKSATEIFGKENGVNTRFALRSKALMCRELLSVGDASSVIETLSGHPLLTEKFLDSKSVVHIRTRAIFQVLLAEAFAQKEQFEKAKTLVAEISEKFRSLGKQAKVDLASANSVLGYCEFKTGNLERAAELLKIAREELESSGLDAHNLWRLDRTVERIEELKDESNSEERQVPN